MTISPTFFRNFACKADKCRHTCCQKWVINIDAESAEKYRNIKGWPLRLATPAPARRFFKLYSLPALRRR